MKRVLIRGVVVIEVLVDSDDPQDAWAVVDRALDRERTIRDYVWNDGEAKEVEYKALPPCGAERWAAAAKDLLFDDDRDDVCRGPLVSTYDGSWWWTNGHVMLRCEGAAPEGWRVIDEAKTVQALVLEAKRVRTEWSAPVGHKDDSTVPRRAIRALAAPAFVVDKQYADLVARSVPGVAWEVTTAFDQGPAFARDPQGRLVAVVMPVRPDGYEDLVTGATS